MGKRERSSGGVWRSSLARQRSHSIAFKRQVTDGREATKPPAAALIAAGHKVRGLVRNKAKASAVAAHDVQAVVGSLDDAALLQAEAHAANAAPTG
jgi:hypothetical protein